MFPCNLKPTVPELFVQSSDGNRFPILLALDNPRQMTSSGSFLTIPDKHETIYLPASHSVKKTYIQVNIIFAWLIWNVILTTSPIDWWGRYTVAYKQRLLRSGLPLSASTYSFCCVNAKTFSVWKSCFWWINTCKCKIPTEPSLGFCLRHNTLL